MADFKVSMSLTAKDEASKVLSSGIKETTKAAADAEKAAVKVATTQKKASDQSIRSTRSASEEFRRAARARETLGVRSEKTIQREIDQTIASYNRLARAGSMSANEQDRAFRSMKARVSELKAEMQGVSRAAQAMGNVKRWGGNAMSVAGGIAAGAAVVSRPVANRMTYERQLSYLTNTAFGDEDMEGRRAGRTKIANSIRTAVTTGGGTKEDAADALNTMLASGAVDYETANKWLPDIMKNATGSGASANDLATLAIKAKQSFGLTDEEIPLAFNMAIAAGKAGNFELKDMARWLAPQMAAGKAAGMQGIDDFAKILALNEMAGVTAGSPEEAGNNVVNLLAKLTSADAANAAKKIKINGKGIDLPNTLAKARERGMDPIEAFSALVDKSMEQNKGYQALKTKLAGAKDDKERARTLDSMASIMEGSAVSKFIADRQALMALLAYRFNPEYRKELGQTINAQRDLPEGQRAGDLDFMFIAETDDFKVDQAKNAYDFAQMDSVKSLSNAIGNLAGDMTKLSVEFPELATAAAGAATSIQAMAAAAIAFAGINFLTGGGKVGGVVGNAAGTAAVAGKGMVKKAGIYGAIGAALYDPIDDLLTGVVGEKNKDVLDSYGLFMSSDYQFFVNRGEMDAHEKQIAASKNQTTETSTTDASGQPAQPLSFMTQLVVDGQVIAEAVNKYNVQDGSRTTGGVNY